MAQAISRRGTQLLIKVGDGTSPETFAHPCLINTERGIQWTSQGSDVVIPDCDEPEAPAWLEHVKDGLRATITGAGTLHISDIDEYDAWFRDPDPKNVQVWISTDGYWPGAFHLTEWQLSGTRTEKIQCSLTLMSEGIVSPWVPQT